MKPSIFTHTLPLLLLEHIVHNKANLGIIYSRTII